MQCGKYGCDSSNVCWWYMCSAPVLVDSRVFWTFVNMLLNTTSLLFATKQLVLFLPPKIWTTCPIKCFSEWCPVTIFWPSELPWCVVKCFTEGWWWYSETNEITILCSKQAQKHIRSVLSCSKNTLFRAYCIPMYACHLRSKYTHRPVWSAYELPATMSTELCNTFPEM